MPVVREVKRMHPHDKIPQRAEDIERALAEQAAAAPAASQTPAAAPVGDANTTSDQPAPGDTKE